MKKELVAITFLSLMISVFLTACGEENSWQRVDLSVDPELPFHVHRDLPRFVGSTLSPDQIEDLQLRMVDLKFRHSGSNRSTYQIMVTYHDRDLGFDYVFMGAVDFAPQGGSVGQSLGQRHIRDYDQPVEYMVHQMINTVTPRNTKIHYVAVWTNSSEVAELHLKANNQSFEVEGEDMIVLRWESPRERGIEHLELTAMDEEGKVIWQDEL